MNRETFLRTLRAGLAGLSRQEIDEILADYETHFDEASASGRSEAEVAQALGDPARLARELRAETGLRRFEAHRSVANLATAMFALAGLAAVDIFFLLPLLLVIAVVAIGIGAGLVALGAAGVHVIFGAVFSAHGGSIPGALIRMVVGFGLVACLVFGGSLLLLGLGAGVRLLGRYVRLHYRLLDPARNEAPEPGSDVPPRKSNAVGKRTLAAIVGLIIAVSLLAFGASRIGSNGVEGASWSRNTRWACGLSWLQRARAGHRTADGSDGVSSGTVTFPFESRDSLDIDLPTPVSYRPGTKAEATVSGDPAVISHVRIANGRLGFDDEIDCIPATHLTVRLTAPSITRWRVNGSGDLVLSDIDQPRLELLIRGSGHIVAKGSVQDIGLNVAGSGTAQLQELSARSAEIVVHGSGDARVAAQDSANIAIAGSGSVKLYGHPATLHSTVSGSGRIENVP
ncbi:putative membrane protein [Herbaspirillum sp. CF444]|uniref:GIN domain-containing protein n=1 Tax=Herbaspirillum sp. CF444 TaxID=1144319 RepID=UPI0002725D2A|nr:DUF1700 domain-containing protein [Herbaspirillum sp. CF444]EJL94046.1 putative membrane protein [Herbaspirillum sp. CF444]